MLQDQDIFYCYFIIKNILIGVQLNKYKMFLQQGRFCLVFTENLQRMLMLHVAETFRTSF